MAKPKILLKALGKMLLYITLYIIVGVILPLLFVLYLPNSIYVAAIGVVGFFVYQFVLWKNGRNAERRLYGKNFITTAEYLKNKLKVSLIVFFWLCLLAGLSFGIYALLLWSFPHGRWIHGVNENGEYFDRRLTIAGIVGLGITFWIARKFKKL